MKSSLRFIAVLVLALFVLAGCADNTPKGVDVVTGQVVVTDKPNSDSDIQFVGGPGLPTDRRVYHITGKVVADAESVVRQTSPARGSVSGSSYDGYGYMSGSFSGPEFDGKTLLRLQVRSISPADTDWIAVNPENPPVVILKVLDLKGVALYPGDVVDLTCRRQAESVAAVNQQEWFDPATMVTWELDFCRMTSPVVSFDVP